MRHLKEWQRYQIAAKLEVGCTKKEIAEYLDVHPSADRKTGKVWLRKLQNPTAAEAADQIIGILECLKQYGLVNTITADNGLQLAEHERVSRTTSVDFFFVRPYHSWERGANENTNGLDARMFV